MNKQSGKTIILTLLKIAVSVGILVYLVNQTWESFTKLERPKNWWLLFGAWACSVTATSLTFVRWYLLVRALDIPFRLRDAFRLGFLGYLFNFVALGLVGGDLFKAVFIAHEHPQRRTEAAATVLIDRAIGLYALFLVATFSILFTTVPWETENPSVKMIANSTILITITATISGVILLLPGTTGKWATSLSKRLPLVSSIAGKLVKAVRTYRRRQGTLLIALVMSLAVHSLISITFHLVASGLSGQGPSLTSHFLIVPLSLVAGALPISFSGLGVFEGTVEFFYHYASPGMEISKGQGFIVALCYRIILLVTAVIGFIFYLAGRREVTTLMREAKP